MLPSRHSRFLSSLRFLQLVGQGVPIADVPPRDLAGPLLACAQPQRFGVCVFQLAGHFFDDFRFALGTKAPQAQVARGHIRSNQAWLGRTIWLMVATNSSQALRWAFRNLRPAGVSR